MDDRPRLEDVARRLRALETANRRLSRVLAAVVPLVAVLAGIGSVIAAGGAPAVEASRFVLRGADGSERGVWSVTEEGGAAMSVRDARGESRLVLAVAGDGRPSIEMRDAAGLLRVRLILTRESSLNFYDRAGRLRAGFGVTSYGPRPLSYAPPGPGPKPGAAVDVFQAGFAGIEDRSVLQPVGPDRYDGPVLKLYDHGGKPRFEARVDDERPFIFLHTPRGTIQRAITGEGPKEKEDQE